jgi:hypothetical protein
MTGVVANSIRSPCVAFSTEDRKETGTTRECRVLFPRSHTQAGHDPFSPRFLVLIISFMNP